MSHWFEKYPNAVTACALLLCCSLWGKHDRDSVVVVFLHRILMMMFSDWLKHPGDVFWLAEALRWLTAQNPIMGSQVEMHTWQQVSVWSTALLQTCNIKGNTTAWSLHHNQLVVALIRGYWCCHLTVSHQNAWVPCQLLSAIIILKAWQTLFLKSPKSECSCRSGG